MLWILWAEHMNKYKVSGKMDMKRTLVFNIIKRQLKFLGYIMRKEGLGNLTHTGHIEDKRDR